MRFFLYNNWVNVQKSRKVERKEDSRRQKKATRAGLPIHIDIFLKKQSYTYLLCEAS